MIGYLAGAIKDCNDDEAHAWRNEVIEKLPNIKWLNPMERDARHFQSLDDETIKWIVEGDKTDIYQADFIFANCWKPGWGTGMEILLAHYIKVPVVTVVPLDQKVSPWIQYHSLVVYRSLDGAIEFVRDQYDH